MNDTEDEARTCGSIKGARFCPKITTLCLDWEKKCENVHGTVFETLTPHLKNSSKKQKVDD